MVQRKKILISGYEIGGQMQLLAETLRSHGISATSVAFNDDFRQFKNDFNFGPKSGKGFFNKLFFLLRSLYRYDVFYFNWGKSYLSVWRFHLLDLFILKLFRKTIIVHFRGGDLYDARTLYDPKNHCEITCYTDSLFENYRKFMRKDQIRALGIWEKYADHIFVSTPDLLLVSKRAELFPQIIDNKLWKSEYKTKSSSDGIIRVLHAPTNHQKKGTEILHDAILQLQLKGLKVEIVLVDNLPYSKTKHIFEQCDICVDQLFHGWYGKISVELMALGKPVICNISPKLKNHRPNLPILHGDDKNLVEVLEKLIHDKSLREEIGNKSEAYVEQYHNLEKEIDKIIRILT
jgi:glycosyltransferase involved in cell wall biosynthesis